MRSATLIRIVLSLGLFATFGLIAAGMTGEGVTGSDPDAFRSHVLLGLLTLLLLTLSHAWVLLYLGGTIWAVRTTLTERESTEKGPIEATKLLFATVAPWSVLALALAIGNFLLGTRVYASSDYVATHQGLFFGSLVAQVVSLIVTARGIKRYDRVIRSVEQPEPGSEWSNEGLG